MPLLHVTNIIYNRRIGLFLKIIKNWFFLLKKSDVGELDINQSKVVIHADRKPANTHVIRFNAPTQNSFGNCKSTIRK